MYKKAIRGRVFLSMITSPIFIVVYFATFYSLYNLSVSGKVEFYIGFIICITLSIGWVIYSLVEAFKKNKFLPPIIMDGYSLQNNVLQLFSLNQLVYQFDLTAIKSWRMTKKYCYIKLVNNEFIVIDVRNMRLNEISGLLSSRCKNNFLNTATWDYTGISIIIILSLIFGVLIGKVGVDFGVYSSSTIDNKSDRDYYNYSNHDDRYHNYSDDDDYDDYDDYDYYDYYRYYDDEDDDYSSYSSKDDYDKYYDYSEESSV